MMPGSPERVLLRNPYLTQAKIDEVRQQVGPRRGPLPDHLGIDPPTFRINERNQLIAFVGATLTGDLGYSLKFRGTPVTDVIGQRFWPTILLIGFGEVIAIIVGLAVGAYAGWRRGSRADRIGSGISLVLYSMPYFVIGMPLILIFAARLGWFPTSGMLTVGATYGSIVEQLFDFGRHLVLPLATVAWA